MRTRTAATAGTVLAVSLGTLVTGVVTGALAPATTPSAAAADLTRFDDCDALRDWYVEQALPLVGPYGLGWTFRGDVVPLDDTPVAATPVRRGAAPGAGAPETAVGSGPTGTTVQEAGVDEPDRAKTDGSLVVHLRGRSLVVTDVTGAAPREIGTLTLPRDLLGAELLLDGDTVLVLGSRAAHWPSGPRPGFRDDGFRDDRLLPVPVESTRVLEVSLADPASPEVRSDRSYGGDLLSARDHADGVRLVLSTTRPTLDFVVPDRERTAEQAEAENRRIVRESTAADWLPGVTEGGATAPAVACADVLHPTTASPGLGTVTVLTLPHDDASAATSTAVTAAGNEVYSSTDRLYLAASDERATRVHAFALEDGATAYRASARLRGTVRDRWSMDEHDGVLRVAVSYGPAWAPTDSGVTTLEERDGALEVVGRVRHLGPEEDITAVRWFDDVAVLVTFRLTDPVHTVDLRDPARPRALGELVIPGFSEYLHPVGEDRLLGVGVDATGRGRVLGGQVSVLDVGDLTAPRRLDVLDLDGPARGGRTWPAAGEDPRAFTWLSSAPGRGTALVAVGHGWGWSATLVEVRLSADGSLAPGRRWAMPGVAPEQARALPLPDDRAALVGARVRLVSVR